MWAEMHFLRHPYSDHPRRLLCEFYAAFAQTSFTSSWNIEATLPPLPCALCHFSPIALHFVVSLNGCLLGPKCIREFCCWLRWMNGERSTAQHSVKADLSFLLSPCDKLKASGFLFESNWLAAMHSLYILLHATQHDAICNRLKAFHH